MSPPAEIEEYKILRLLGRGAMGEVYLAEDTLLDRLVAIKLLAARAPSDAARARFFNEARAVARLSHPNVVAVFRVGEAKERPFLVSEYVRGTSLDRIDKPAPNDDLLAIARGLARGLAAAHRRGVLHRDIKPANAMRSDDGEVKLLDFGLAKLMDEAPAIEARGATVIDTGEDGAATATLGTMGGPEGGPPKPPRASTLVDLDAPNERAIEEPQAPRITGTPLYLAPELWRGDPPTPRSDVYSFGALLFELATGRAPFAGRSIAALARDVPSMDAPDPRAIEPSIHPAIAALIARALDRDPMRRPSSGEALREALDVIAAEDPRRPATSEHADVDPYPGLAAFGPERRSLFFGREADVRAIVARLDHEPLVIVAGDSGAGKSSLLRAGVIPAIEGDRRARERGAATNAERRAVTIALGRSPLLAIAAAIAPLVARDEGDVARALREDPASIARALRTSANGALIVVDALEELVTLAGDDRDAAAEALAVLSDHTSGARFLAGARGDFLGRLAALPGLGDKLSSSLYLLRPLDEASLARAIEGPAEARGYRFESEAMVRALVDQARAEGGALPLLQFALASLWAERDRDRRVIPEAALDAIGGVGGALARHADLVLARLPSAEIAAAQRILVRLVTAEGTRAQRSERELLDGIAAAPARAALAALVRGRLLVARERDAMNEEATEARDEGAYTIAHEALITGWDTLRGWLGNDAELRALERRIERAAAEWERLGRAPDALLRGLRLNEVARVDASTLGAREAAFLDASRRAARRARLRVWGAAAAIPIAIGATAIGVEQRSARALSLRAASHVADGERALAEADQLRARAASLRQDAFARFDRGSQDAEPTWAEALDTAARYDKALSRAIGAFEAAQEITGDRSRRAAIAAVLFARAEEAERARRIAQRDEILARLAAYDTSGEHRRRWSAKGSLRITTRPAGARVTLARSAIAPSGARRWVDERTIGEAPIEHFSIDAGSLLITLTREGRAPVRVPIVVERGEERAIDVDLPAAERVPKGFVYVPPGRFLWGSGGDEDLRRFFGLPPIHPVETSAYLIADHEVTFAEYIAFLRALPREERAKRTPNGRTTAQSLALRERDDGRFELAIRPTVEEITALEGEPIRYPGRSARASQDWLRFPVSAVSFEDATAYATWLHRTGAVPGARLCTEREWERAARGADDRRYPHGDALAPDDANHDATYGRSPLAFGPDEAGAHPLSESPFGLSDMAGNVWEWTVGPGGIPVERGGSYYHSALDAVSINREPGEPTLRSPLVGIRVCATPKPE